MQHGKAAADVIQEFKASLRAEKAECSDEKLNQIKKMITDAKKALDSGNGGAQRVLAIALDQEFFHSGCPLRVSGLSLWL